MIVEGNISGSEMRVEIRVYKPNLTPARRVNAGVRSVEYRRRAPELSERGHR
jgi:hypothetical protein